MALQYLIRHGESESNAGLPTLDPSRISLTALGLHQAEHISNLELKNPTLIVTSSFKRAKQTAAPTIDRFPDARIEEWPVQEFTYLSPDKLTPMTISQREPVVDQYWREANPHYVDGDGAESFSQFIDRIRTVIGLFPRDPNEVLLLFSHGQFIKGILWVSLTTPEVIDSVQMSRFYNFLRAVSFPNGSMIETKNDRGGNLWLGKLMHLSTD